tara:strand:- start:398 stop:568 length:171 start_codon:yes stop_codon:yes gene_type:complete
VDRGEDELPPFTFTGARAPAGGWGRACGEEATEEEKEEDERDTPASCRALFPSSFS